MSRPVLALIAALVLVCLPTACSDTEEPSRRDGATVTRIGDGDSLELRGGVRVRLLQVDAPELGGGECYAREALRALERLAPSGERVLIETDAGLDRRDRHGRLLRYVQAMGTNVNVELVRRGAATPYFVRGERGRYADDLLSAVDSARAERRGLWGACRVRWRPTQPVETRHR
jgi:endonuclease YncB( thermonuclease family)